MTCEPQELRTNQAVVTPAAQGLHVTTRVAILVRQIFDEQVLRPQEMPAITGS
jgi:hypothetical protein